MSLWSFVPEGHPAYPAAVDRKVVQQGNDLFIQMSVLCEASKAACDALVTEVTGLNERLHKELSRFCVLCLHRPLQSLNLHRSERLEMPAPLQQGQQHEARHRNENAYREE